LVDAECRIKQITPLDNGALISSYVEATYILGYGKPTKKYSVPHRRRPHGTETLQDHPLFIFHKKKGRSFLSGRASDNVAQNRFEDVDDIIDDSLSYNDDANSDDGRSEDQAPMHVPPIQANTCV